MITVITSENYREHKIGKKAERLFVLKENGFSVPDFFCVNDIPESETELPLTDDGKYSVRSAAF